MSKWRLVIILKPVRFCDNRFSQMAKYNFQKYGFDITLIFLSFCFAKKKETKKKATTRSLLLGLNIYAAFYLLAFVL